jgi:multiple sugar transport system ATP-binding protein
MSFLVLERLQKTYGDGTIAVRGIELTIERGELVVLLGPSGCGKTTTLRMIAGLELATSGSIRLAGNDVTRLSPSRRDVGMVFQFYALYPHLTVRDNIAFPLRAARAPRAEVQSRVDAVAARMDLGALLARYPRQLSGGDQQKVALARAIVRRPSIYLMDEPLGTLDADQRLGMRELIRAEQLASGVTTIYVTHDQEEAMSLADRVVVMDGGRIRQVGAPGAVYDRPADLFVARFVGSPGMNFIEGEILVREAGASFVAAAGQVELELPRGERARTGRVILGVRCEHVHEDADGPIAGRLVMEEYLGSACNVHLQTAAGRLVMRAARSSGYARGSALRVRLDSAHLSFFDAASGERR